jgi:hypothetical protein
MNPYGRLVLGALPVFVLWTAVRAWRSGVIFSQGSGYSIDKTPALYVLGLAVHGGIAIYCALLAAGFTNADIWQWLLWLDGRH